MNRLANDLRSIIGDGSRVVTDHIEPRFLSDVLGRLSGFADAVVFPVSTQEVSEIMKYSYENEIPVTPRGAGTNLVGSTVPVSGGIILDLSRMNRILELDTATFTATVEPGVILEEFQKYVEDKGLFYPPDPGEKTATIGGTISTNAGGMRAVKYGVTRDYVRGLELVLANGEVMTVGSKNVKDSSGLSLTNLIIGSEGTLAVITKCILKLLPLPEASRSIILPYPNLSMGIQSVLRILHANISPTAVEFIERSVVKLGEDYSGLRFPFPNAGAYLLLTFDGDVSELKEKMDRLKIAAHKYGALDFLELDEETAADVWKIRGCLVKAVEAVSEQEPVDIVVPIDKTADFLSFVHAFEKQCGMQMVGFGHAGDGNVHLCVVRGDRSQEAWELELKSNMNAVYNVAQLLGGLTSGEHGIGLSKKPYFLKASSKVNLDVMNRIKLAFDDKSILNHHKAYIE